MTAAWKAPFNILHVQFNARWRLLSPTAQRITAIATVLLVAGLLWALVLAPLQQSRTRNAARIVELRTALAEMKRDAAEVAQIRALPPVTNANRTLADPNQLTQVFAGATVAYVQTPAGSVFRVKLAKADWSTLVSQLETATARHRLRVSRMALTRDSGAQTVTGELDLSDTNAR